MRAKIFSEILACQHLATSKISRFENYVESLINNTDYLSLFRCVCMPGEIKLLPDV